MPILGQNLKPEFPSVCLAAISAIRGIGIELAGNSKLFIHFYNDTLLIGLKFYLI